jgi:2-isopropylmalate synthase
VLEKMEVVCGNQNPSATIKIRVNGISSEASATGTGPVDAATKCIDKILNKESVIEEYLVQAITGGSNDTSKVHMQVKIGTDVVTGFGADSDIVVASVHAYIDALNKLL